MTKPTRITLNRPLTVREVKRLTNNGEAYLQAIMRVSLTELIASSINDLNDLADERIVGGGYLTDISYTIVGHTPPTDEDTGGMVLLLVCADVNEVLDDEDEENA